MIHPHLIREELRQNFRSLAIWTGVVLAFTLMTMAFFPSIKEAGDDLARLLESMPQGLLKGMGMDEYMMTTSVGFYKVYYGVYIVVIMGIYLFSTGAGIFAKEEANKTIEFIMSRPLNRPQYFWSKCLAACILYAAIVLIQLLFAYVSLSFADSDPLNASAFFTMHLHGAVLLFFFLSLGILSSVWLDPRVSFIGLAVGIVFGSYFINALVQGTSQFEWLGFVSPFYYADFDISRTDYRFNVLSSVIQVALSLLMIGFAYHRFQKRDFLTL